VFKFLLVLDLKHSNVIFTWYKSATFLFAQNPISTTNNQGSLPGPSCRQHYNVKVTLNSKTARQGLSRILVTKKNRLISFTGGFLANYVGCQRVDFVAQTATFCVVSATCRRHVSVMSLDVVSARVSKMTRHVGCSQHVS
jgi:hypothetical protein